MFSFILLNIGYCLWECKFTPCSFILFGSRRLPISLSRVCFLQSYLLLTVVGEFPGNRPTVWDLCAWCLLVRVLRSLSPRYGKNWAAEVEPQCYCERRLCQWGSSEEKKICQSCPIYPIPYTHHWDAGCSQDALSEELSLVGEEMPQSSLRTTTSIGDCSLILMQVSLHPNEFFFLQSEKLLFLI